MVRINSQQALQNIQLKNEAGTIQNRPQLFAVEENDVFCGDSGSKGEKITFKEGAGLFLKGAKTRFFNLAKEIKDHPVRTALLSIGTVTALSLLPLIGITVASGAAVIAGIFGVMAGAKIIKDVSKIAKFNHQGEYNKARGQIKNLGGDTFDLAMVLPFMPKGFKQFKHQLMPNGFKAFLQERKLKNIGQIKTQFKTRQAFKLNKDLLREISKTDNYFEKLDILLKSNIKTVANMNFKEGFFVSLTKPITSRIPGFNGSLFNNLTSSSFGTFMGVASTSSLIAKKAKEIGFDDENCKIIEERTKDVANIVGLSPYDKFINVFNSFSGLVDGKNN